MIKEKMVLMFIFIHLIGCHNNDDMVQSMDGSFFKVQRTCIDETKTLVEEWKLNGGGYNSSLMEMRLQIKGDEKSQFSQMVKIFWQYQDNNGYFVSMDQLGEWPISDEKFRMVFFETVDLSKYLSNSCGLNWLADVIHDNVLIEKKIANGNGLVAPPEEFPKTIKWESNQAQMWLKYWLFVNVK